MISLYSGTPGSGKSYHMVRRAYDMLRYTRKTVICNMELNLEVMQLTRLGYIKRWLAKLLHVKFRKYNTRPIKGRFVYMDDKAMTPAALIEYSVEHLKRGVEGQALILIDEAAMKFNSRSWQSGERAAWVDFLIKHRHYGYDIVFVCMSKRMLDRQIRDCIEFEYVHRNVKNVGFLGQLASLLFAGHLFVAIEFWIGTRDRLSSQFIRFHRRIAACYDSYAIF